MGGAHKHGSARCKQLRIFGHYSEPHVFYVHECVTYDAAFDALLRFRDPQLEALFWRSAKETVQSNVGNAAEIVAAIAVFMLFRLTVASPELMLSVNGMLVAVLAMGFFLTAALCIAGRQAMYRWCGAALTALRVVRYAIFAIMFCIAVHSDVTDDAKFLTFFQALAHHGLLFWANFFTFLLSLRFSLHVVIHTFLGLPVLLYAASQLAADVLTLPQNRQSVCAFAHLSSFETQRSGVCHPLAAQQVAYTVSIRPAA